MEGRLRVGGMVLEGGGAWLWGICLSICVSTHLMRSGGGAFGGVGGAGKGRVRAEQVDGVCCWDEGGDDMW